MTKSYIEKKASDVLFMRDNYRRLVWLALLISITCSCLVAYIFYNHITAPAPISFATTTDGQIIHLTKD